MYAADQIVRQVKETMEALPDNEKTFIENEEKNVVAGRYQFKTSYGTFFMETERHDLLECKLLVSTDLKFEKGDVLFILYAQPMPPQSGIAQVLAITKDVQEAIEYHKAAMMMGSKDARGKAPASRRKTPAAAKKEAAPAAAANNSEEDDALSNIPKEIRGAVAERRAGGRYMKEKKKNYSLLELKMIYRYTKEVYRPEAQRVIDDLLEGRGGKADQRLKGCLAVAPVYHPEPVTTAEFSEELQKKILGRDEVKACAVSEHLIAQRTNGKTMMKILLIGPPGVGKVEIAQSIANARHKPSIRIPYGSMTNVCDIGGTSSVFDSSKAGIIGQQLASVGTTDCTMIFEDIDNASHEDLKNGDPDSILQEVLAGCYHDLFWEVDMEMVGTWIIATAKDDASISPKVQNAFDHVFYLDALSNETRFQITKQYLLPELLRNFCLLPSMNFISDALIRYLLKELCYDDGMEQMLVYLRALLCYGIEHELHLVGKKITEKQADKILGKEKIFDCDKAVVMKHIGTFTEADQKALRKLIVESERKKDSTQRDKARLALKTLAGMFRNTTPVQPFSLDEYLRRVSRSHSGMEDVKLAIARKIRHKNATNNGGKSLLLVGPPGVGKTTLCQSAAEAAGFTFTKISCNGVTDASYFKGTPRTYKDASPGRILSALSVSGGNAIVLLDEVDKIGSNDGKNTAVSALLDLLDAKQFTDLFLNVVVDLSGVIFVATANYLQSIPAEIYDRFEVVTLSAYTTEEKRDIFRNHILPKAIEACGGTADTVQVSKDAEDLLVQRYSSAAGARELQQNCEKLLDSAMLENKDIHVITAEDVVRHLGPAPINIGRIAVSNRPGVVHGLAVTGLGLGCVTTIEVKAAKASKVTGMVEGSALESIYVAQEAAVGLCPGVEGKNYHVHLGAGENSTKKNGSSAGIALAIGLISCESGIPADPYAAYTGELGIFGDVYPVGGVTQKIQAAIDAGLKRVFIPCANYAQIDEETMARFSAIEVIPVSTLREVYERVFGYTEMKAVG